MTREGMYISGCLFAVGRLIEDGSSSFAIKVSGEWKTVPWDEIIEWLEKQYALKNNKEVYEEIKRRLMFNDNSEV